MSGSNLTADQLNALIGSGSFGELARVSAARISIPSISMNVTGSSEIAGQLALIGLSLTNVVLDDVRDGWAAAVTVGAVEFRGPPGRLAVYDFVARNIDVSGLLSPPGRAASTNATVRNPSFVFEDVSFDIPDPGQPGHRITMGVLHLDAIFESFRNGVPTSFDIEGIGLTFDLPANIDNPMLAALRATGVAKFNGTFLLAAAWDESSDIITIREASLTGRELGGVFLTAEITKAGKALFSKNLDEARSAVSRLAVRFVSLAFLDSGVGNLVAASMAKSSDGDVGTGRAALVEAAEDAIRRLLSASEDAGVLSAAVKKFVAGASSSLEITVQAKTGTRPRHDRPRRHQDQSPDVLTEGEYRRCHQIGR